jgi:hypothetical protein
MARMVNCTVFVITNATTAALEAGEILSQKHVQAELDKFLEARGGSMTSQQISDLVGNIDALGFNRPDDEPGEDLTNEFPRGEFPIIGENYFPNGY